MGRVSARAVWEDEMAQALCAQHLAPHSWAEASQKLPLLDPPPLLIVEHQTRRHCLLASSRRTDEQQYVVSM
jgi:hypothetical protein